MGVRNGGKEREETVTEGEGAGRPPMRTTTPYQKYLA